MAWELYIKDGNANDAWVVDDAGAFVAAGMGPMARDNARLIAAAPDMLAALEAVTACLRGFHAAEDFGPLDDEAIEAALSAISKAKEGV